MTAASAPQRESLGQWIRATTLAIVIMLSPLPALYAYGMIVDPDEFVGGLFWEEIRLNQLADETTRDFPEFFGAAAEEGLAAEADEGGYVFIYLVDEALPMADEVCTTVYQAMLHKDPTLMSGFMLYAGAIDGPAHDRVHCGGAWWTWWWNDLDS